MKSTKHIITWYGTLGDYLITPELENEFSKKFNDLLKDYCPTISAEVRLNCIINKAINQVKF